MIAKDNHPTLHEDIADLFLDRTPDRRRWVEAETWEKGHGRLEHRHLICSPDLNDWFAKDWQGLAQVFRLQRTTCLLKESSLRQQTVYGLSNVPMSQVPAQQLLELIRAHWRIENRLHWRRDVTLGEDACQTRTGHANDLGTAQQCCSQCAWIVLGLATWQNRRVPSMPPLSKPSTCCSQVNGLLCRMGKP